MFIFAPPLHPGAPPTMWVYVNWSKIIDSLHAANVAFMGVLLLVLHFEVIVCMTQTHINYIDSFISHIQDNCIHATFTKWN